MSTNADLCRWLHQNLEVLPVFSYPFDITLLPRNGIYFFYAKGECCAHATAPRIVRVGTHRDGNFRSRISEHFLLNDRKMVFTRDQPAPHDRSIFRKHLGRALLNKAGDPYLSVWGIDFTTRNARTAKRHLRDVAKEVKIEREVTEVLRQNFSFRFIEIVDQAQRMGAQGLERALIGTLANCPQCMPSAEWLGGYSPDEKIRTSGLWLIHHLRAEPLSSAQMDLMTVAIQRAEPGLKAAGLSPAGGGRPTGPSRAASGAASAAAAG